MTVTQVKKLLQTVAESEGEVKALLDEAEMMEKLAVSCDGTDAKTAAAVTRRYGALLHAKVNAHLALRQKIRDEIALLPDADCRLLLTKRYLLGEKWERIAEDMNFSTTHIFRLHNKSLALAAKCWGKDWLDVIPTPRP